MKYLKLVIFLLLIGFTSCDDDDCVSGTFSPICQETPPNNELCQAYFERWFYVEASGKCELIGYSGCSQYGFETQEACLSCTCID